LIEKFASNYESLSFAVRLKNGTSSSQNKLIITPMIRKFIKNKLRKIW